MFDKNIEINPGSIYFSLYELGVQMSENETSWAIPEKVIKYLADRVQNIGSNFVLNAFSHSGNFSI